MSKLSNIELYINIDYIIADFNSHLQNIGVTSYFDYWNSYNTKSNLDLYNIPSSRYSKYLINKLNEIFPRWSFTFICNCSEANSRRNSLIRTLWILDVISDKAKIIYVSHPVKDVELILQSTSNNTNKFLLSNDIGQLEEWIRLGGLSQKFYLNNTDSDINSIEELTDNILELSQKLIIV